MTPDAGAPEAAESPSGEDLLRRASGFVYVDDLEVPTPDAEDAHHLVSVLRLRPGEVVVASDGAGSWRRCRLAEAAGRTRRGAPAPDGLLVVDGPIEHEPLRDGGEITVAFALPKGERAEWTVQKLTEIGVDRIVPLLTERTVVRLDRDGAARRAGRFGRIVKEAGAQSRRPRLPVLEDPRPLEAHLAGIGPDAPVAIAEPGGEPIDASLREVLVGPEGGWSDRELSLVRRRVGLGATVLRAETAAIAAGVLLMAHHARDREG